MDPTSQALAIDLPPDVRDSISVRARHGRVPRSAVHYRSKGRPSRKAKAEGQQYLTPSEEEVLVYFLLRMSAYRSPVRIEYLPWLAFCIACRMTINLPIEPPKRKWSQAYHRRHPELNRGGTGLWL